MAEIEARIGTRTELVVLGHTIEPGTPPKDTWQQRAWHEYQLVLIGMKQGAETTLAYTCGRSIRSYAASALTAATALVDLFGELRRPGVRRA